VTAIEARELAGLCYVAPEAALPLILRACDAAAPELQRRALQALRWLDPEEDDPPLRFGHGGAGDVLGRALVTLAHDLIYHASFAHRRQCSRLVAELLKAAHPHAAASARTCA
jgi:hypothetical protein